MPCKLCVREAEILVEQVPPQEVIVQGYLAHKKTPPLPRTTIGP